MTTPDCSIALTSGQPIVPVFIFDREILDDLPVNDARVEFIHQTIHSLQEQLLEIGSSLVVEYGKPIEVWPKLVENYQIQKVFYQS